MSNDIPPQIPPKIHGPNVFEEMQLTAFWEHFKRNDERAAELIQAQSERVHNLLDRSFRGFTIGFMKQVEVAREVAATLKHIPPEGWPGVPEFSQSPEIMEIHAGLRGHVWSTYAALATRTNLDPGDPDTAYRLLGFTIRAAREAVNSIDPKHGEATYVTMDAETVLMALDKLDGHYRTIIETHDARFAERMQRRRDEPSLEGRY